MSYIKITNTAPLVNRLYLEKLGLSTKRDNEETIGQFGSGTKFAPIAALRNGWEWITVATDEIGPYRMDYIMSKEQGIDCIGFRYDDFAGNEVIKESSFTADAGVMSWNSPFQVFREAFNNAIDAKIEFGSDYSLDIVDEIVYEPGVISIYLSAVPELLDIVKNIDKYFLINRTPISDTGNGHRIFESVDGGGNIYHRGVLVHEIECDDGQSTLFDYEFANIQLNEERTVTNQYRLTIEMARALGSIRSGDKKALKTIADRFDDDDVYEWDMSLSHMDYAYFGSTISDEVKKKWGYNAKVYFLSEIDAKYAPQVRLAGYIAIVVKSNALHYIVKCSQQSLENLLGPGFKFNEVALNKAQVDMFNEAYDIVCRYDPALEKCVRHIKFFDNDDPSVLGVALGATIYLQTYCFTSVKQVVGTLIHELDHVVTMLRDEDPQFRLIADKRIEDLVMRLYSNEEVIAVDVAAEVMEN